MPKTLALILLIAFHPAFAQPEPDSVVPVINEVEPWQDLGQQPYEMTWTQRREHPETVVDFEDMKGWTLALYDGAQGELRRSQQQQMWGQYVARIEYSGTSEESHVVARPPEPVPIPNRFDSIEFWAYGNRWAWQTDETTPPAEIAVWISDATEKEFRIECASVRWKTWWLVHRKVPAEVMKQIAWPAKFVGIEIAKGSNKEPRPLYFDSLAFFTEQLEPIDFAAQPKRNLKPFRGQIVGTNTGPGTLPFPTREETILPMNFERDFRTSVRQTGDAFEFRYEGADGNVVYTYRPETGVFDEIALQVAGGPAMSPMAGGGMRFAGMPEGEVATGELLSATLDGNALDVKFRYGSHLADFRLQLWQKSLVIDVWCDGGEAVEVSFGHVSGARNPKLITVPYITYGGRSIPRVLLSGSADKPTFTSIWFDWYRSNASTPYVTAEPEASPDKAEINGGLRYIAKTDGQRNNVYDRIFLTASPRYEEVLPTIANPPSLRQSEGSQVVWTVCQPRTFEEQHQESRRIAAYGLDRIMQHSHEVTWRDHGGSYTVRLKAAPQKGGNEKLRWYIDAQNKLGWLQGVYSNYCDFAPVNTNWTADYVQREPDGEWRRAWARTYGMKPAAAVELDERYARQIKEMFGVKMSYTDVHTAVSPWRYCDFDARVPGAGTLAATFYAYGQVLLNDQRVYGPTQSEGTFQWLWAGLESGAYGWVYTNVNLLEHPVDIAFNLWKIHPLECNYGMGYFPYYVNQIDKEWRESPKRREYVDLFLATTIAYGNMGWLVRDWGIEEPFGVEAMTRSYYMMQQLQQQYAFVEPKTVEYFSGGRYHSPSEAHANGALEDSQVHVSYKNGTEVYVNRNPEDSWTVSDPGGQDVTLPVSGWLVTNADNNFYEFSALDDGHRIDYAKSAAYEYLDGRTRWTLRGSVGASGGVVRREQPGGVTELIDLYGNDRLAFQAAGPGTMLAYDPEGALIGPVELTETDGGWFEFRPVDGGRKYLFRAGQ